MNRLEIIIESYPDETFLSADGFEDVIIGVTDGKLVYSITRCIEKLMIRDNMTFEMAVEFFEYNVIGAYVGEKTPIWFDDEMFSG